MKAIGLISLGFTGGAALGPIVSGVLTAAYAMKRFAHGDGSATEVALVAAGTGIALLGSLGTAVIRAGGGPEDAAAGAGTARPATA